MSKVVAPMVAVTVTIAYPADNSDVPGGGSFTTYGNVTPSDASMSSFIMNGTTRIDGTATTPPPHTPPYDWAFNYTNVPTGVWVWLNVVGTSGPDTGAKRIKIRCVT